MWNKVYCDNYWYNVDTTWDDPINNLKNNLSYDYFMINDDRMFLDHMEYNFSFETPDATDDSMAYYVLNEKYAEDLDSAKSIIKNSVKTAVQEGTSVIRFQCSSKSVYKEVLTYLAGQDMYDILTLARYGKNKDLIDALFTYSLNDGQYTITILFFYKNTSLDDYYSDRTILSDSAKVMLKRYGIK